MVKSDTTFGAVAIGMSWQLAVIVLVPIVGGYKLDRHLGSVPLWTLIGLVVAMVGSILVIRRSLAAFGNFTPTAGMTKTDTTPTDANADKSTDINTDKERPL